MNPQDHGLLNNWSQSLCYMKVWGWPALPYKKNAQFNYLLLTTGFGLKTVYSLFERDSKGLLLKLLKLQRLEIVAKVILNTWCLHPENYKQENLISMAPLRWRWHSMKHSARVSWKSAKRRKRAPGQQLKISRHLLHEIRYNDLCSWDHHKTRVGFMKVNMKRTTTVQRKRTIAVHVKFVKDPLHVPQHPVLWWDICGKVSCLEKQKPPYQKEKLPTVKPGGDLMMLLGCLGYDSAWMACIRWWLCHATCLILNHRSK